MPAAIRNAVAVLLASALPLPAQEEPAPTAATVQQQPAFRVLAYPKDKDFVAAEVDGRQFSLERLAEYLEGRHCPGFRTFLATDQGQLLLRSDMLAPWVRHFADIMALIAEAEARKLDTSMAEPALADALTRTFRGFLDEYVKARKQGNPEFRLTDQQVDRLRADFQMRNGLDCELQGWLDFLEPADYSEQQLRDFFADHAREFGGMVTFAHILVPHRDAGTGLLLDDKRQGEARARLADIKARLLPDGSNFQEIARLMSADTRTAPEGGVMRNVTRFDRRLPAILCRTAWLLKDGETSDVIESEYGFHLVQRLEFSQQRFMVFTADMQPLVRQAMQQSRQEDLLFDVRKRHRVKLHL